MFAVRLKCIGHICPECGEECTINGRFSPFKRDKRRTSGWLGFHYWSCCYRCRLAYLILFDDNSHFVSIVPNGPEVSLETEGTMYEAGHYQHENGDIPF